MREIDGMKYYTLPEAAVRLDAHPASVRRWVERGELKAQQIGGRLFVSDDVIREYLGLDGPVQYTTGIKRVTETSAGRMYFTGARLRAGKE